MGDFGTAVKYLDWVKSRQASLLEAEQFPVPFDKYYGLVESRELKKIPYVFNIPAHTLDAATDFQYLPRLIFQYRITSPFILNYIIKISKIEDNTLNSGVLAIRYVDDSGIVFRYAIKNNFIGTFKLCELYNNQILLQEFFLEYWLGTTALNTCGISKDLKFTLNRLTNPLFPEELEREITIEGPFDYPDFSWNIPFTVPQINVLSDVNPPSLLSNELGIPIVDELGRNISINI